jgi:hypothetical protein
MHTRFHIIRRCLLLLVVSLSLSGTAIPASASAVGANPGIATSIGPVVTSPGSVVFTGHGFTPNAPVYIALYDTWGARVLETRWVTSSAPHYSRHGSIDPATGGSAGGSIRETFANLCGIDAMIRAYDQHTATWGTWHTITATETHCTD